MASASSSSSPPPTTTTTTTKDPLSAKIHFTEAARHLCQEARTVLCSLRGGPPAVARGELAHDLQDLRVLVRAHFESCPLYPSDAADAVPRLNLGCSLIFVKIKQR